MYIQPALTELLPHLSWFMKPYVIRCAFALTDHDCIDGIKEAQEETLRLNSPDAPEVIAGVELSCELDDREIHMVGLYINPDDKVFNNKLNAFRSSAQTATA